MNRDREVIWGRSVNSKRVHLIIDGKRQCLSGCSRGPPVPIIEQFPDWKPDNPLTCSKCKERYFWLKLGAVPVEEKNKARKAEV